jgi:hypothetical protein
MEIKARQWPQCFFNAGRIGFCVFALALMVACGTAPIEPDEGFNSKDINRLRLYVVVDPDSKRDTWKKKYGTGFNSAVADHLRQKGYEVEHIYQMGYTKARGIFGSTLRFPHIDEDYGPWLASIALEKDISAVIIMYIQFQHYYSGVKTDWLSEMSLGYCIISAARGRKLICSDFQTFSNTEKGKRTYVGTTSFKEDGTVRYPFDLHRKKDTQSFIKESVDAILKNLPSKKDLG